ncbi:hypothetical protein [Microbacterium sp. zg.B96]|nr:hypothetical protein [Microbacterium sp. zg.B96]MCR2785485.1 hypothetical protein [Microbacterium sp. zg.B96]
MFRSRKTFGYLDEEISTSAGDRGAVDRIARDVCYEVFSPRGETPQTLYARSTAVVVMVSTATGRPVRLTPRGGNPARNTAARLSAGRAPEP